MRLGYMGENVALTKQLGLGWVSSLQVQRGLDDTQQMSTVNTSAESRIHWKGSDCSGGGHRGT